MRRCFKFVRYTAALSFASLPLASCGNDSSEPTIKAPVPIATTSDIVVGPQRAGPTPFIAFVELTGLKTAALSQVQYRIEPRPGTASLPVNVSYTLASLANRGRINNATVSLPVFGLYADYANTATITLTFTDGSRQALTAVIPAAAYTLPSAYARRQFNLARAAGSSLGFDFYAIKPASDQPASLQVFDSDGFVRWISAPGVGSAALFRENGFDMDNVGAPTIRREELDGTITTKTPEPGAKIYHHDFGQGPEGILVMPDYVDRTEDILLEVTPDGRKLHTWDMAQILGDFMRSNGDDPRGFVRPGVDWFHMNSAIYDPRDRSVIISSRENFVIKVDHATGQIKWILGDTSKHWYSFASLRTKALTLAPGAQAPIGQHSLSLLATGELLMFNNGTPSLNHPSGTSPGANIQYSAINAYKIDEAAKTAQLGYIFDDDKKVSSPICSSGYMSADGSLLITYSQADSGSTLRIKGINAQKKTTFDISYLGIAGCASGWNSIIVPFDRITFAQ